MKKIIILTAILLLLIPLATAATLKGSVYNSQLEVEENVLVEIDTVPQQKYLAKDGNYQFELSPGKYTLTAMHGFIQVKEEVEVLHHEGTFLFDVFLLADFTEEDELWQATEEELFVEGEEAVTGFGKYDAWRYWLAGIIILFLAWRLLRYRKKYGRLKVFRKKAKEEHKKTIEQHKAEIANEPGYIEKAVEIIKKNDGRISQKQLRKEMLPLSEAKVSLIVTELEHRGKVEKVKKGRGNVILLK